MKLTENLLPKDGEAYLMNDFFSGEESERYYQTLLKEVEWKQEPIVIFGKKVPQPRLTAWFGDADYRYSGLVMKAHAWSATLLEIKKKIETLSKVEFNGVLLNYYRDEKDSMGWHRDNEKELGLNPVIGSVNFGATRDFDLRHYEEQELRVSMPLKNGSFLLMKGATQHHWQHRIAKKKEPVSARINLTFRRVQESKQ
jgi:alkylated DNA repair dioxygenase AlkB